MHAMRFLRHRWMDERSARRALPGGAIDRLEARVRESERLHTGQIRLCVEGGLPLSYLARNATPRERALTLFGKLGVWNTEANNGVLVYLLLADHAIEIVADRGLSRCVTQAHWADVVNGLSQAVQSGEFERGLGEALDAVSAQLVRHFPVQVGVESSNELPDRPLLR